MNGFRLTLGAMLLLGVLTGLVDNGTVAYFQRTGASTTNLLTAGTVDIANSPTTALISIGDMVPGETVTAPLSVTNGGSLTMRYAMASTVTNPDGKGIGAQLTLTVKSGVTACSNAGFGASGSVVYGSAALGSSSSSVNVIGTPGSFPNGGRSLSPSSSETLCFQVALPASTDTSFQGASTTATFTFSAQQV